jgi:hypothetical protein
VRLLAAAPVRLVRALHDTPLNGSGNPIVGRACSSYWRAQGQVKRRTPGRRGLVCAAAVAPGRPACYRGPPGRSLAPPSGVSCRAMARPAARRRDMQRPRTAASPVVPARPTGKQVVATIGDRRIPLIHCGG